MERSAGAMVQSSCPPAILSDHRNGLLGGVSIVEIRLVRVSPDQCAAPWPECSSFRADSAKLSSAGSLVCCRHFRGSSGDGRICCLDYRNQEYTLDAVLSGEHFGLSAV